jgi:hypothetical protein
MSRLGKISDNQAVGVALYVDESDAISINIACEGMFSAA